jgi:WD40 repeat protein
VKENEAAPARTHRLQRRSFGVLALMLAGVVFGLWQVYDFWRSVMLNRAEVIASQADDQTLRVGDPVTAMLLALEALPDAAASRLSQRMMPREASAQHALDWAWRNDALRPWRERKPLLHEGPVDAAAFSPDGKLVLTGSADKTARLWETAGGKLVATLSGHEGLVRAVAFSPDGKLVLTGSDDKTARLWETAGGKLVATLSEHEGWVDAVAFSPDGKLALTGSWDGMARLWEAVGGKLVATLAGHEGRVNSVAFSPSRQSPR